MVTHFLEDCNTKAFYNLDDLAKTHSDRITIGREMPRICIRKNSVITLDPRHRDLTEGDSKKRIWTVDNKHALLLRIFDHDERIGYCIQDFNSRYGTFISQGGKSPQREPIGRKIVMLQPGTKIYLGNYDLLYTAK